MTNNLLKSVVASAVIATGVSAETPNLNSAPSVAVRESSIDFKSQIAQIDKKITQTQTKIDLILQKGNLSEQDQLKYLTLENNIEKLMNEKFAIRDANNKQLDKEIARLDAKEKRLDKTIARIDDRIDTKKETVTIIDDRIKELDNKLSIADQKLDALDRISKILNK